MKAFYISNGIPGTTLQEIKDEIKADDDRPFFAAEYLDPNIFANDIANMSPENKALRTFLEQKIALYQKLNDANYPVVMMSVKGKIAEEILRGRGFIQVYEGK